MSTYDQEQQVCLPEPEETVFEEAPMCSVPEQNTVGNSERASRLEEEQNGSGTQLQMESSLENSSGTSFGMSAGTEGLEVQVSREIIPSEVEMRVPLSGIASSTASAGIWLSVRPSLQFSGRASYGPNASGEGSSGRVQGRVHGSIQAIVRGGVEGGDDHLLATVFGGGDASVQVNVTGQIADDRLSLDTFSGDLSVAAIMGLELKARIPGTDWDVGKRFTWSPGGPQQLIVFTGPTWRQGQGFSGGFQVDKGSAIHDLEQWYSQNIDAIGSAWSRGMRNFGEAGVDYYSGGGLGDWCWVAREVIPEQWQEARNYIRNQSPASFQELYGKYGPLLAQKVARDDTLRQTLTPAFLALAQSGREETNLEMQDALLVISKELISVA